MDREILRLAIPNIISNVVIPLLGVVDLIIIGHLGSESYIGAIGLGTMLFNFVFWAFAFLRMSVSGLTAQAYGAQNDREMSAMLYRGALVALGIGLLLVIAQIGISYLAFIIIESDALTESLARQYFFIRIWTAPAVLLTYVITGWFIGMQNARYPMCIAIFLSACTLLCELFFVYYLGLKSDGIAWGTLIAQYASTLLAIVMLIKRYPQQVKLFSMKALRSVKPLKRFFTVNGDIFIRMLCVIFVMSFFMVRSARVDTVTLAINTILIQFLYFFSFFIDGFAYAGEALIGKYKGAGDYLRLRRTVKRLFIWGIGLVIPFVLIYLFFASEIIQLITNNEPVRQAAQPYLIWVRLIPVLTFAAFIWDGIFIGAAASRQMRNTMLFATLLIFLPVYFGIGYRFGNHGLWVALLLYMLGRGLYQTVLAKKAILGNQ